MDKLLIKVRVRPNKFRPYEDSTRYIVQNHSGNYSVMTGEDIARNYEPVKYWEAPILITPYKVPTDVEGTKAAYDEWYHNEIIGEYRMTRSVMEHAVVGLIATNGKCANYFLSKYVKEHIVTFSPIQVGENAFDASNRVKAMTASDLLDLYEALQNIMEG